eukprot:gene37-628_t
MSADEEAEVIGGLVEKEADMKTPPAKKVFITASEIKDLGRDDIISRVSEMDKYISSLEEKCESLERLANTDVDEKLKLQQQESTRRENVLVMRLATKEQEMQELLTQIHELKQSQNPSTNQLKSTLLDPSVNLLFEKMKSELGDTKEKLEQAQNDLSAWKFTPDSVTGKKLMAKCRMLIAENQELGKQLSQGRIAQLEAELALQKKYNEELKSSQDELNEFVLQLDEEVEGMQSTICALQQQLKDSKQKYQKCYEEMIAMRPKLENDSTNMIHGLEATVDNYDSSEAINSRSRFQTIELDSKEQNFSDTEAGFNSDIQQANKTLIQSHDVAATLKDTDNKASTKNPFFISNLLSSDFDRTKPNARLMETDEDRNSAKTQNEEYPQAELGTNGGYVDSDHDMSS